MPSRRDEEVILENVTIRFANFEGKEGRFNRKGDRNFCVILEPEVALAMEKDGWNITHREGRNPDEGDEGYYFLKVKVSYNPRARPPQVFLISGRQRTALGEDEIQVLDWAEIENADLIIAPYHWDNERGSGQTAYLRSLYVTIYLDPLARKYGAMEGILPEE